VPVVDLPYVKLGSAGHWRRQLRSSEEWKTFIQRGSASRRRFREVARF
jgi:hypothetical protein